MSHYLLFHDEFRLRSVLIPWGFISQGFHELIGENLNICPSIANFFDLLGLLLLDDVEGFFGCVGIWNLDILGGDEGGVGVSPKHSFIPHKIIVDEFSRIEWKVHFVFLLFFGFLFFVLGLGLDNLGDG